MSESGFEVANLDEGVKRFYPCRDMTVAVEPEPRNRAEIDPDPVHGIAADGYAIELKRPDGAHSSDIDRVFIEVDVLPNNGTNVDGNFVRFGRWICVAYVDRLDAIRKRVMSDEHREAYQRAYQVELRMFRDALAQLKTREASFLKRAGESWGSSPQARLAAEGVELRGTLRSMTVLGPAPRATEKLVPTLIDERKAESRDEAIARGIREGIQQGLAALLTAQKEKK